MGRVQAFWSVAAACLTVQCGFGAYPVVIKWFAEGETFNMVVFSTYRDVLCTPCLLLAARLLEGRLVLPASARELRTFAVLGLTGIGGQRLCFILGLYYTSPTVASVWQNVIPVFATAFSILFRQEPLPSPRERLGRWRIAGFILAIGGAVVMNLSKNKAGSTGAADNATLGTAFLMANTLMTGFYLAFQRREIFNATKPGGHGVAVMARWKQLPVHVTAWSYMFGSLVAMTATMFGSLLKLELLQFGRDSETDSLVLPSSATVPLVYALLIASALNYGLLSFANKHAPSSLVSAFWPFQVPVAGVLSALAGLGTLSALEGVGAVLIIAGLVLVCASSYFAEPGDPASEAAAFHEVTRRDSEDSFLSPFAADEDADDGVPRNAVVDAM